MIDRYQRMIVDARLSHSETAVPAVDLRIEMFVAGSFEAGVR